MLLCCFGNGIPVIHAELERYIRKKEPIDDAIDFFFKTYENYDEVKYFTHCVDPWEGGIDIRSKAPVVLGRRFMILSYLLGRVKRSLGRLFRRTKKWAWNCTVYWETDDGVIENPEFLDNA